MRLGVSTTSGYYSDAILGDWANQAHRFCANYKLWPFVEGRNSTTYVASQEEWNYPENFIQDSIRFLDVGGKRFTKTNFREYKAFREDQSSSEEKVFTDFARILYVNPNSDASGTLTVWGRYMPGAIDITDATATTVFSNVDEDGNLAMVEEMLAFAYERERDDKTALFHHQKALEVLEMMFKKYADEQSFYMPSPDSEGMFKRIDVIQGDLRDDVIKRDQFY